MYTFKQRLRIVYAEIVDDGRTVMILPLMKDSGGKIFSLSSMNGLKNYDAIYDIAETREYLMKCVEFFFSETEGDIELDDVSDNSPIVDWAEQNPVQIEKEEIEQIRIPYPTTHEEYIAGLTKNAKQNIRTAYNRMRSDEKSFQFEFYEGQPVPEKEHRELLNVYCKRRREKYHNASVIHSLYLKYLDWITKECQNDENSINAVLKIDGRVAAFMSGFRNIQRREVSIPRLAIDADFSRYSPGVVLLNETAKALIKSRAIQFLDLYGNTAPYKKQMGGQLYYKYKIKRLTR